MAALPPSNTPRFRFHYTTVGEQHTFQVRSHASPSNIGLIMDVFLTALGTALFAWTLDLVEFAPTGSDIFNPVTTGFEGNNYGAGLGSVDDIPRAYTFLGRSTGGRRWRMAIFGATSNFTNYRVSAGESALIDAAIAVLVFNRVDFVCIDDLNPVFYTYADVQLNDHWIGEVR